MVLLLKHLYKILQNGYDKRTILNLQKRYTLILPTYFYLTLEPKVYVYS